MHREGALDAHAVAELAHGVRLVETATLTGDHITLEDLDALLAALDDAHVHLELVARLEVGDVVAQLVGVDEVGGLHGVLSRGVVGSGSDARPAWIAADLLAQAEHDPDARPLLIALDPEVIPAVNAELEAQLTELETRAIAERALQNGGAWLAPDEDSAVAAVDRLAPEHLELPGARAGALADRVRHYGALFTGRAGGEVFGDYGAGPNHVLPTGGSAKRAQGLSVLDFLRLRTQLHLDDLDACTELRADAAALADLEGLAGHARAARCR